MAGVPSAAIAARTGTPRRARCPPDAAARSGRSYPGGDGGRHRTPTAPPSAASSRPRSPSAPGDELADRRRSTFPHDRAFRHRTRLSRAPRRGADHRRGPLPGCRPGRPPRGGHRCSSAPGACSKRPARTGTTVAAFVDYRGVTAAAIEAMRAGASMPPSSPASPPRSTSPRTLAAARDELGEVFPLQHRDPTLQAFTDAASPPSPRSSPAPPRPPRSTGSPAALATPGRRATGRAAACRSAPISTRRWRCHSTPDPRAAGPRPSGPSGRGSSGCAARAGTPPAPPRRRPRQHDDPRPRRPRTGGTSRNSARRSSRRTCATPDRARARETYLVLSKASSAGATVRGSRRASAARSTTCRSSPTPCGRAMPPLFAFWALRVEPKPEPRQGDSASTITSAGSTSSSRKGSGPRPPRPVDHSPRSETRKIRIPGTA